MTGYPQDPKQMQAAYSSQQNMMSGMIPQQGYGSIPQSQHQQQAQQRISQHYPQSGHQMYPTPPQQAPAPQPYGGYGVQHQSSRSTSAQHPGYSHTGLDQSSYGHLPNQGPVGLPPIGIQQTQQSHLTQTPQSHQQQQQQLHQLQHPSMNPAAQPPVLGSSHGAQQQAQSQQQSHLTPQSQHAASAMHHSSSASQHQSTMAAQQANQASHQIPQVHNPAQMPHQMGHGMLPSYGSQMAAAPAAAPPQVPTYLPNSKQTPATQQHGSSPQYRAPFPQLSPQMSPRPQMSPHPQMSPRAVMSPAKPPTQQVQNVQQASSNISSPHPHMPGISSPSARSQPTLPPIQTNVKSSIAPSSAGGVNTLAALEQMVMPGSNPVGGMDYNQTGYRQQTLPSMPNNPLSPLGSRVTMSPQHQQHQQWPTHRSQMNGSHHGMMPQAQMQMQQQQQMQQNQSAGQMMAQLPDLMSASQPMQVIPPSNQHQQSSYNSYEELTQVTQPQQKSTLDSIHKPYENLTPSIPSQQMGNSLISQQLMSPTLQNQQQQQQQQMDTQDQYVSLQTNQSSLSTLESTDQSSDLNLLDSYSNSATVNTSNMSSTAQKSSIDDSLLSQTTNDNSQSSQISDNANNILQVNSFTNDINHDDNANQQSMDQDLPCLDPTDGSDDYQKPTEMENDHVSQDSQEQEGTDKIDELQFGFGNDQGLKPKSADSTMINETEKSLSNEMTNVVPDIVNNVSSTDNL
jgi:chromodomain-helicase-DNA-binding protein 7